VPTGLFINNDFVPASDGSVLEIQNPTTCSSLGSISAAQKTDVDKAVTAAKVAYNTTWKKTSPEERRRRLLRLADLMERDAEILASLESVDAGILYRDSFGMFVPQAVETCRYYAGWADKITGDSLSITQGMAYTRREPFGVCAAIVPWNAPLMITIWKLAPALAAGNVLVIKPPELASLFAQKLAQLIVEAGFPAGVVNIIPGLGHVAGQALAEHAEVRKISFTGSTVVGRKIQAASSASNFKKTTLELGGKSPSIVFADADLPNALAWATAGITVNNGQICAAGSRIYVQDSIYDDFVAQFAAKARDVVAGDPLLEMTTKGPIISATQKERIMGYIQKARDENLELLYQSNENNTLPPGGHFVPNIGFGHVGPEATIMKEEIFGPVASIGRFRTEEEVIELANATEYGLAAAVFTSDISRALRVSDALESGQVTVNMWGVVNANTAFGGVKSSGTGRDLGKEAMDEWTHVKCVKINVLPEKA
jgi:aldehyde dehydrogenase (NAD+)